jgi:hypothetical protein
MMGDAALRFFGLGRFASLAEPAIADQTIGQIIAANMDAHREQWSVDGGSCLQSFTNATYGWTVAYCETYAGDSIELSGIPLTGSERRELRQAVWRLQAKIEAEKRTRAVSDYNALVTQLGSVHESATGEAGDAPDIHP